MTGLVAKHLVIPLCDGEGTEKQFARLLADLQQEFQPEGPLEEFYVGEMAKSMWRLRRATCAEKGSVRRRIESSLLSARNDASASVSCMYFDHSSSAESAVRLVRSRRSEERLFWNRRRSR